MDKHLPPLDFFCNHLELIWDLLQNKVRFVKRKWTLQNYDNRNQLFFFCVSMEKDLAFLFCFVFFFSFCYLWSFCSLLVFLFFFSFFCAVFLFLFLFLFFFLVYEICFSWSCRDETTGSWLFRWTKTSYSVCLFSFFSLSFFLSLSLFLSPFFAFFSFLSLLTSLLQQEKYGMMLLHAHLTRINPQLCSICIRLSEQLLFASCLPETETTSKSDTSFEFAVSETVVSIRTLLCEHIFVFSFWWKQTECL